MANIIDMPKLSDTMTVGTLVKWLKKEGDAVKSGDMLAEVETDKATMELESFFDGTLIKIFAPEGSQVAIGAALCAVGQPGEAVSAPLPVDAQHLPDDGQDKSRAGSDQQRESTGQTPGGQQPTTVPAAPVVKPQDAPSEALAKEGPTPVLVAPPPAAFNPQSAIATPQSGERLKISPLARKIATDQKIDPARLAGTGPHGRIVKADVLAAVENPALLKAAVLATSQSQILNLQSQIGAIGAKGPIQADRTVPASNIRGIIAKRLLEAKTQIPHFYLEIEIDAEPLLAIRAQLNTGLEKEGVKLSVNDFVL